jgi:L-seryl-tRNA(Ser) seleniumtransferase
MVVVSDLRNIPSVDKILQQQKASGWIAEFGSSLTLVVTRATLDEIRLDYKTKKQAITLDEIVRLIELKLHRLTELTLRGVINATGVVLHTNLGRAPISQSAMQAMMEVARGYVNLEFDLEKGKRGSRLVHTEELLTQISGAEASIVVNNNAAAVLLILTALAKRRGVVIARSQLVEIGGGFRIPEVMAQSGARLIEVGTTNRIHLSDYEQTLALKPALFMRVHRSNFQLAGFTSEPNAEEIAQVAHLAGIPLVDDLGSGSLLDTSIYGLSHEPMVQESLQAGCDLVCFSGDKLLGGPQAGIIVGKKVLVEKLKKHPLSRAVRADKFTLACLSATLVHYLKDQVLTEVPVWKMISAQKEELGLRVTAWMEQLNDMGIMCKKINGESTVGGGCLPGGNLPTVLLAIDVPSPDQFSQRLRLNDPPVIARVQDEMVVFDPRTVLEEQDNALLEAIKATI